MRVGYGVFFVSSYSGLYQVLRLSLLRQSGAYMYQETRPSRVKIMDCCLLGTKPSSAQMLDYGQLYIWGQISVTFESKYDNFHSRNAFGKC